MFKLSVTFFILTIISAVLGFSDFTFAGSIGIAVVSKVFFFVFLVLFILTVFFYAVPISAYKPKPKRRNCVRFGARTIQGTRITGVYYFTGLNASHQVEADIISKLYQHGFLLDDAHNISMVYVHKFQWPDARLHKIFIPDTLPTNLH